MNQSTKLIFDSKSFYIVEGEDEKTNPGIFGKSLAQWLSEKLSTEGYIPKEIMPEDFGWCVPLECKPHNIYVACSNSEEKDNSWQVYIFSEASFITRLLNQANMKKSVNEVFESVKKILNSSPNIFNVQEESM